MWHREVECELNRTAIEHRLLLGDALPATPGEREGAIESDKPFVRVDRGFNGFKGRRRGIRVERNDQFLVLRTRTREATIPSTSAIPLGRDLRNREVPLAHFDRRSRTLQFLVEIEGAEIIDRSGNCSPAQMLVQRLVDDTLQDVLATEGSLWIGPRVTEHVSRLMNLRLAQHDIQREIQFLENLLPRQHVPEIFHNRLQSLRRLGQAAERREKSGANEDVTPRVEAEVARLGQLVTSRACSVLRFRGNEISGLINPRYVSRRRGQQPIGFTLLMARLRGHPILQVWDPRRRQPRARMACLGDGESMLCDFEEKGNVFGMVDTVLNYCENNLHSLNYALGPEAVRF